MNDAEIKMFLKNFLDAEEKLILRRELYNYRFLDRSKNGRVYQLAGRQPLPEELGL